jgi:hypothetical protein
MSLFISPSKDVLNLWENVSWKQLILFFTSQVSNNFKTSLRQPRLASTSFHRTTFGRHSLLSTTHLWPRHLDDSRQVSFHSLSLSLYVCVCVDKMSVGQMIFDQMVWRHILEIVSWLQRVSERLSNLTVASIKNIQCDSPEPLALQL